MKIESKKTPFLSIIIRTQGKRFESLKETFLCLLAQTDQDFEIVLVLHKADETGKACVNRLFDMQLNDLQEKTRILELNSGERGAPLNYALSVINGHYFTFLDDDDLVFDDWTLNFHEAALSHDGSVIRCYGVNQEWRSDSQKINNQILRSSGAPNATYCSEFSLLSHLTLNNTPISCAAYPTAFIKENNLSFDEKLTTTEDWDFMMRCVFILGIHDTKTTTFLYRIWSNAESSYTLHQHDEWTKNENYIRERFLKLPITITGINFIHEYNRSFEITFSKHHTVLPNHQFLYVGMRHFLKLTLMLFKRNLKHKWNKKHYLTLINNSDYFDEKWYLKKYPDIKASKIDPAAHYLYCGWLELRDPSPDFSTRDYLIANNDILSNNICPLLHYELHGKQENRKIRFENYQIIS